MRVRRVFYHVRRLFWKSMAEPEQKPPPEMAPRSESETAPAQASPLKTWSKTVFIDPQGLRPAWRVLLYFALWRVLYLFWGDILQILQPHVTPALWLQIIAELGLVLTAAAPALLLGKLERRAIGDYGLLPGLAFGKLFWSGIAWGIVAITVLLLVMHGVGVFEFGRFALHGLRILKFAAFWGAFFLLVGFYEEFLMRGYSQFTLSQAIGFWPAAILLSLAFGAIHLANPGESRIGITAAAAIGLFFCLTLRRTGNLWFAIGFHAAWDWGESYLYSVPDSGTVAPGHLLSSYFHGPAWLSGGSVGPEGSVLVFVIIALLWILFERVYPEVKYRVPEQSSLTVAN
jgi:CAAX protease family protein